MNVFTKQYYIDQANYIVDCIARDIRHGLREIIIDNFAGGGGASTGIELATGYSVFAAINHDPEAIRMHKTNHPTTKHYCESVWEVDPLQACEGHPVGLAWFSPDCKHFSKAKGGKPKDKNIRGLAWVALRWAALVRPRVIMLENVEEFKDWGPLNRNHRPIKSKKGVTFKKFVSQLEDLGYQVEFRELVAADYGAPTMRKRFFLVARYDRMPIVWPERTNAPAESIDVKTGKCSPYVGAYTQIDFNRPCPSIFESAKEIKEKYGLDARRPLADNTMKRIARGLQKFVIDNPEPFIVQANHGGDRRPQRIREPLPTITGKHGFGVVEPYMVQIGQTGFSEDRSSTVEDPLKTIVSKNEHCLIEPLLVQCKYENELQSTEQPLSTITSVNSHLLCTPTLIQYHSETGKQEVRGQSLESPIMTVDAANRYGMVSAFVQKYFDGGYKGAGADLQEPLPTITAVDHNSICTAHIVKMKGDNVGHSLKEPLQTITAGGQHYGEVTASLILQQQGQSVGTDLKKPLNTVTGVNHMSEVRAFLIKYYGQGTGQDIANPLDTVTANDRFGLVTIAGVDYQIIDIGLRMLEPKELYGCQGFPDDYIIDRDYKGKDYKRSEQVKRCGNAVPPPFAKALVRANLIELCVGERMPNMQIKQEETGQLRFA